MVEDENEEVDEFESEKQGCAIGFRMDRVERSESQSRYLASRMKE
jgi:hypothetical protein